MIIERTPHDLHLLFCTNTRSDHSKSCGDSPDTEVMADRLKARFKAEKMRVRITRTACLGPCAQGPNIMAYPQRIWFQEVAIEDTEIIFQKVKSLLEDQPQPNLAD